MLITKNELEFIEKELAIVGKKDDSKKIVEAAGAVAAALNSKYASAKKELEIVKTALDRTRVEYEAAKNEINLLKTKSKSQDTASQS
jgi:hypothetical protein